MAEIVTRFTTGEGLAWAISEATDGRQIRAYDTFNDYYHGRQQLAFATEKFKTAFAQVFGRLAYNRCAAVADAMTDRLFVERFTAGEQSTVEDALAEVWLDNRMDRRQGEVFNEALVSGDGYLLVWPDPVTGKPTLWPQRAAQVRVRYDEEQPGQVVLATKVWRLRSGYIRANIYHPDRIERWITAKPASDGSPIRPEMFVLFDGDSAGPVIPNPWDVVPMFHIPNNGRTGEMGQSELRDVLPIQDLLNKTLTDMMVAEEFASFSQKVIIGVETDPSLDTSSDPISGHQNAAALQKFTLGVDRILALADPAAKIAEFSAVALAQFVEIAEFFDAATSRVSKVPVHYLTLSGDFPSGRALRTAEAPFVAKLEDKQRAFGNVLEDAMRLALAQAGTVYDGELTAVWRSAAPMADEDRYDLVAQMTAVGVPLEIALRHIGWTDEEIDTLNELKAAEAEARVAEQQAVMTAEAEAFGRGAVAGDPGTEA